MRGKFYCKTDCGLVTITNDQGNWIVWIYDWLHSEHSNEVKAIMMLQKLTRPKRKNDIVWK